jgi:carbamoyltransferase
MATYYVGLAASFHDPALAIVASDGEVLFAEAQERYLQDKRAFNAVPDHILRAPKLIRDYCGSGAEVVVAVSWSKRVLNSLWLSSLVDVPGIGGLLRPANDFFLARKDHLVWPWPSFNTLRKGMLSVLNLAGHNLGALRDQGFQVKGVHRFDHHLTHAATACFTSPFDAAACAVIDGYGEWSSTNFYTYRDGAITPLQGRQSALAQNSGSLGMFYSKVCALCGFDSIRGEEWKVMGLAPYGRRDEEFYELLRPLVTVDGLTLRNPDARATARRLNVLRELMAEAERDPNPAVYQQRRADLGRTGQEIFAEVAGGLLSALHAVQPHDNLAFGGGCALNSSYTGQILRSTPFREVHVPMAPGDDGNALGAALLAWSADHPGRSPARKPPMSPYLGSAASPPALDRLVRFGGFPTLQHLPDGRIVARTAELLAQGRIVGWFQGRAEFGPRALGNRSILADPRDPTMKDRINDRVKFREEFRPFAPSILHEHGPEWFEDYQYGPYMERTLVFRPEVRARVPAVVHEDATGRLQSVTRELNPRYYDLISAFHGLTGVPIVLNTSFNVMGKPIVHSVEDAIAVFATSGLDALAIDDYLIEKEGRAS